MAAPVIESTAQTIGELAFANSGTVGKPSGTAKDNLLLVHLALGVNQSFSDPGIITMSGFTEIANTAGASNTGQSVWLWKIAGSSEGSSYSYSWSGPGRIYIATMFRVTGHDASAPINAVAAVTDTTSTYDSPSITTTVSDCLLLFGLVSDRADRSVTIPSGTSANTDASHDPTASTFRIRAVTAKETKASSGATGSRTWTYNGSTAMLSSIAIAPAAGGGGGTTYDRDAAVTSASDFAASAVRTQQRAADISGVSSFTASGAVARLYARDMAIASASSFAAAGTVTRARAALMASVSTLAAVARLQRSRSVVVAGASTFAANRAVTKTRSAAFAGASAFTATGEVAGQIPRSASFASQSSFSVERVVTYSRSAAFAAVSRFTASVAVDGTAQYTSSGRVGTSYAYKTLSQIKREKKAELANLRKEAKERVVEAVERSLSELLGVPDAPLKALVRREVTSAAPSDISKAVLNDIIARIHAEMRRALIRRQEEEDEADVEILLLAA